MERGGPGGNRATVFGNGPGGAEPAGSGTVAGMRTTAQPAETPVVTAALAAALMLAVPPAARAHPEPFTQVRGAQTEVRGEWEVEQWTTARLGKMDGTYAAIDFSTEIEYGVTDRLQAALYVNSRYYRLDGAAGGRETFEDQDGFEFDGLSGELKYQLADPFQRPWGFALYFEPGFGRYGSVDGEREDSVFLEFKGIVEKHFFDHRLITAFNYTLEPEWERAPGEDWETELEMGASLGVSWQLSPRWRVGVEARFDTEFEEADLDQAEFNSLHVGPVVHYGADSWYTTLAVLPQVTGWPDAPGTDGRHLDDREAVEIRWKVGVEF